jgi:hypothetical protein
MGHHRVAVIEWRRDLRFYTLWSGLPSRFVLFTYVPSLQKRSLKGNLRVNIV